MSHILSAWSHLDTKIEGGGGGQVVFEGAVNEWSHLHQRVHVGKEEL